MGPHLYSATRQNGKLGMGADPCERSRHRDGVGPGDASRLQGTAVWEATMTIIKGLAAAAALALSVSGAAACDDYEEEMALAAAIDAAKLAKAQASQPPITADVASPAPGPSDVANLASADAKP